MEKTPVEIDRRTGLAKKPPVKPEHDQSRWRRDEWFVSRHVPGRGFHYCGPEEGLLRD